MEHNGTIGTHNGRFHSDEVMACFMLKQLPAFKDAKIIRTRDVTVLETCDIVVDVGGIYDHSKKRYDHHMKEFTETAKSLLNRAHCPWEIKLSSAGLIYCYYGHDVIRQLVPEVKNEEDIDAIFLDVYNTLIREIDAVDNGVPICTGEMKYHIVTDLSSRIQRFNPTWNVTDVDTDAQFLKAMEVAGEELKYFVRYAAETWLPARIIVKDAIDKRFELDPSGEIIELSHACGWKKIYMQYERELKIEPQVKFALGCIDDQWKIQCVSGKGDFALRLPFPKAWSGLHGDKLSKIAEIEGCIFVHANGFLGINSTREGALAMARKTLELHKKEEMEINDCS